MDLPSPSSPHVRQEQIDQLRSRVDNVLRNLVKSTELDTQSLKTQVESLRESPASLLLDSTATDKSLALNENTTTSKQKQSPVTTKLGVVDNDPKSISNVSKRSTTTTTSQWIVDPYGDQGEFEGDLNEENLPHGFGVMKYTDGRIYSGHWKNGRWHGNGRATFSNGDVFEGTYYEDQRHGQGVYRWVDGREFRGGFLNDQRSGHGVYTWPDGAVYDGEFVNGLREGHGKYTVSLQLDVCSVLLPDENGAPNNICVFAFQNDFNSSTTEVFTKVDGNKGNILDRESVVGRTEEDTQANG